MKNARFSFLDPGAIIAVVVSLIVLGVGVYAFFVTWQNLTSSSMGLRPIGTWLGSESASNANNNTTYMINSQMNNTSGYGGQVFNIIGVVLIIGAIMSIVGLVYNYIR